MPSTEVRLGLSSGKGRREINEDWRDVRDFGDQPELFGRLGRLYIVADGMGGYASGEVASHLAVETTVREYERSSDLSPAVNLRTAIRAANAEVYRQAASGENRGMGTTVVASAIVGAELYVAHVGDSRAYLWHSNQLLQLTQDHSAVNDRVRRGLMTAEDAARSEDRHFLSRAIGKQREVEVEAQGPWQLQAGDVLLLCTDGVCGYLSDEQIKYVLETNAPDPQAACDALYDYALASGSDDNITALAVRIDAVRPAQPSVGSRSVFSRARPPSAEDKTEPIAVPITQAANLPESSPDFEPLLSPIGVATRSSSGLAKKRSWVVPAVVFLLGGLLLGLAAGLALAWTQMPMLLEYRASFYEDEVNALIWNASDAMRGTPVPPTTGPVIQTVLATVIVVPTPAPTDRPTTTPTASPTTTPTITPTATFTATPTATLTLTATFTPTPTQTVSPAPTATRPGPTLTTMIRLPTGTGNAPAGATSAPGIRVPPATTAPPEPTAMETSPTVPAPSQAKGPGQR